MNQLTTDKELYTYLIHDIQAIDSSVHSRLIAVNEEIRRINKQPYIHKQITCLEKFKQSRKNIDKLLSKISSLLHHCLEDKRSNEMKGLKENTEVYKSLKQDYFKLE